jgi:hypothetical protein
VYREDATVVHRSRFGPGEEAAARAFLDRPLENRRFWMIPNRRIIWVPLYILPAFLGLGAVIKMAGIAPDWLLLAWMLVLFFIVSTVVLAVLLSQGLFVLDPVRKRLRYRKHDMSFDTMTVPWVSTAVAMERRGGPDISYTEEVEYTVLRVGRSLIFQGDDVPAHKVEEIADRLNSMLLEYREREEVRAWLRGRERALKAGAPARRRDGIAGARDPAEEEPAS